MEGLLHHKGMGDVSIPYKGYVEANLTISDLPHYNEDVLFLGVTNHKYEDRVPVQIDMQVIDKSVAIKTKNNSSVGGMCYAILDVTRLKSHCSANYK